MPRKKKNLLKNKKIKYGALLMGVLFVLLLGHSLFFSGWGTYGIYYGTGIDYYWNDVYGSISPGDTVDAEYLDANGWSLLVEMYTYDDNDVDLTTCELIHKNSDTVITTGTIHSWFDKDVQELIGYFVVNINGAYQGTNEYYLKFTGAITLDSQPFYITGMQDAELPPGGGDDGGDDDEPPPTTPEFVSTPNEEITIAMNETIDLVWTIKDDNPSSYVLSLDDEIIQQSVVTANEFTFTATIAENSLEAGEHVIEFEFEDVDGNVISHSIILTVTEEDEGVTDWLSMIMEDPMLMIVVVVAVLVLFGGVGASRRG